MKSVISIGGCVRRATLLASQARANQFAEARLGTANWSDTRVVARICGAVALPNWLARVTGPDRRPVTSTARSLGNN